MVTLRNDIVKEIDKIWTKAEIAKTVSESPVLSGLQASITALSLQVANLDGQLKSQNSATPAKPPHPWITPLIAILGTAFVAFQGWMGVTLVQHGNTLANMRGSLAQLGITVAASNPGRPDSQSEAKTALAEARKLPKPLPNSIVADGGRSFIDAAPNDLGAWNVALEFAAYRTSQNKEQSLGEYYPFGSKANLPISRFTINYPRDKTIPQITTSKTRVSVSLSARLEPITEPAKQDGPDGPLSILAVGGAVGLDGVNARHVVFQGTEIYYNGGAVNLREVVFVNCLFHLENNPSTRAFAQAVIAGPAINFQPTHF